MIYLHFNNKTVIPLKDLKSAYKCFMSNSRFLIHRMYKDFSEAIVYKDDIKIYEWIYCEELNTEYIDDNFNFDNFDSEPIVFCPGSYYFFSKEVK